MNAPKGEKLMETDSIAIVSGGLDSTTLVYDMLEEGYCPHLLSFNYGQRHVKELKYAMITAQNLRLKYDIINLTGLTHLISNSALTSLPSGTHELLTDGENLKVGKPINIYDYAKPPIEVPEGSYDEESMKATVVPNRNMIMLSIAAGVAVNEKAKCIGIGVHSGDHAIYPDCRPEFVSSVCNTITKGTEGFHSFPLNEEGESDGDAIYAPFLYASKADIAYRALELGVPLHLTWSCYRGGGKHCGKCGTCVERLEAIDVAITRWNDGDRPVGTCIPIDQTEYENTEFWRTAVRKSND